MAVFFRAELSLSPHVSRANKAGLRTLRAQLVGLPGGGGGRASSTEPVKATAGSTLYQTIHPGRTAISYRRGRRKSGRTMCNAKDRMRDERQREVHELRQVIASERARLLDLPPLPLARRAN